MVEDIGYFKDEIEIASKKNWVTYLKQKHHFFSFIFVFEAWLIKPCSDHGLSGLNSGLT